MIILIIVFFMFALLITISQCSPDRYVREGGQKIVSSFSNLIIIIGIVLISIGILIVIFCTGSYYYNRIYGYKLPSSHSSYTNKSSSTEQSIKSTEEQPIEYSIANFTLKEYETQYQLTKSHINNIKCNNEIFELKEKRKLISDFNDKYAHKVIKYDKPVELKQKGSIVYAKIGMNEYPYYGDISSVVDKKYIGKFQGITCAYYKGGVLNHIECLDIIPDKELQPKTKESSKNIVSIQHPIFKSNGYRFWEVKNEKYQVKAKAILYSDASIELEQEDGTILKVDISDLGEKDTLYIDALKMKFGV